LNDFNLLSKNQAFRFLLVFILFQYFQSSLLAAPETLSGTLGKSTILKKSLYVVEGELIIPLTCHKAFEQDPDSSHPQPSVQFPPFALKD